MTSLHVPDSMALVGMVFGVLVVPVAVIGTLFLITKLIMGV